MMLKGVEPDAKAPIGRSDELDQLTELELCVGASGYHEKAQLVELASCVQGLGRGQALLVASARQADMRVSAKGLDVEHHPVGHRQDALPRHLAQMAIAVDGAS